MTLKWSIPEIMEHQSNGLSIDTTVSVEDLREMDAEIRAISPVHVKGHADINRHTVTFFLTISGKLTLPDAVTLEDVTYPFHIQTSEIFRLLPRSIGGESSSDSEVHDVEAETIDLMPYIKEAILVDKPIRVTSGDNRKQPAPRGEGWSFMTESEQKEQMDPRFEKLKDLFNE